MLTLIVFVSRLLPFLSFDLISYAAGLSALHFWRFAIATLAGIIPASFFLAHMGAIAMTGDSESVLWTIAVLGVVSGLSLIAALVSKNASPGDCPNSPNSERFHHEPSRRIIPATGLYLPDAPRGRVRRTRRLPEMRDAPCPAG